MRRRRCTLCWLRRLHRRRRRRCIFIEHILERRNLLRRDGLPGRATGCTRIESSFVQPGRRLCISCLLLLQHLLALLLRHLAVANLLAAEDVAIRFALHLADDPKGAMFCVVHQYTIPIIIPVPGPAQDTIPSLRCTHQSFPGRRTCRPRAWWACVITTLNTCNESYIGVGCCGVGLVGPGGTVRYAMLRADQMAHPKVYFVCLALFGRPCRHGNRCTRPPPPGGPTSPPTTEAMTRHRPKDMLWWPSRALRELIRNRHDGRQEEA